MALRYELGIIYNVYKNKNENENSFLESNNIFFNMISVKI